MAKDEAGFWKPDYSFTDEAAAEARAASRRYWAKGGAADRAHPVAGDIERMWPLSGQQPERQQLKPKTRRGGTGGGE
jgi:hypothetical protein